MLTRICFIRRAVSTARYQKRPLRTVPALPGGCAWIRLENWQQWRRRRLINSHESKTRKKNSLKATLFCCRFRLGGFFLFCGSGGGGSAYKYTTLTENWLGTNWPASTRRKAVGCYIHRARQCTLTHSRLFRTVTCIYEIYRKGDARPALTISSCVWRWPYKTHTGCLSGGPFSVYQQQNIFCLVSQLSIVIDRSLSHTQKLLTKAISLGRYSDQLKKK